MLLVLLNDLLLAMPPTSYNVALVPHSVPVSAPKDCASLENIESRRLLKLVEDRENLLGRRIRKEFKASVMQCP